MAMVNVNNLLNIKDSRWLQLEVCREFQRNKCSRPDTECKFAHPPANVEVQNGRITACYDSIKGRCNREKPPCKYFHPPLHLKDQLLINGRNHLALKNALMQQMGLAPGQSVVPGQVPAVDDVGDPRAQMGTIPQTLQGLNGNGQLIFYPSSNWGAQGDHPLGLKGSFPSYRWLRPPQSETATNPYLSGVTSSAYNPYFATTGPLVSLVSDPSGAVMSPLGIPQQAVVQKVHRADRLEYNNMRAKGGNYWNSGQRFGRTGYIDPSLQALDDSWPPWMTYPGIVAYKRPAGGDLNKSGVPVYQPANTQSAAAYQHLMQLQQPFVPVSSTSIQHTSTAAGSLNSTGLSTAAGVAQEQQQQANTAGLINGSLDNSGLGGEANALKMKAESQSQGVGGDESSELLDNGNVLGGGGGSAANGTGGNEVQDESKGESAVKRMRVVAPSGVSSGSSGGSHYNNVNSSASAAAAIAQNNAAYVAAAQNYHSTLAAMNYTGVSLQTNKNAQIAAAQAAAVQPQHNFQQAALLQQAAANAHAHPNFQQHSQQQQFLSQYQAAMAAALAGQNAFQNAGSLGVGGNASQQQGGNVGLGGGGFNPLTAAAAMNPYFAASLPQLAAAQRAGLLANHSQGAGGGGGLAGSPFHQSAAALQSAAVNNNAGGGGFNPFAALQFGGAGSAAAFQQNQQQQAILAAYGLAAARGSVPVAVSGAQPMPTQQLFVGNPTVAAAALQPGVKRMRPS